MITLKNLHKATEQEVFDQVSQHLLQQGVRSVGECCLYKYTDKNGRVLKCAAGCLIAEGEYNSDFEQRDWNTLISKFQISSNHSRLIANLQNIHDTVEPKFWRIYLKNLATKNNLKTNF